MRKRYNWIIRWRYVDGTDYNQIRMVNGTLIDYEGDYSGVGQLKAKSYRHGIKKMFRIKNATKHYVAIELVNSKNKVVFTLQQCPIDKVLKVTQINYYEVESLIK